MKRYSGFFYFLLAGSVLLLVLNCYLFTKNRTFKIENRELILRNDSLLSVTIELRRQLTLPEGKTAQNEHVADKK